MRLTTLLGRAARSSVLDGDDADKLAVLHQLAATDFLHAEWMGASKQFVISHPDGERREGVADTSMLNDGVKPGVLFGPLFNSLRPRCRSTPEPHQLKGRRGWWPWAGLKRRSSSWHSKRGPWRCLRPRSTRAFMKPPSSRVHPSPSIDHGPANARLDSPFGFRDLIGDFGSGPNLSIRQWRWIRWPIRRRMQGQDPFQPFGGQGVPGRLASEMVSAATGMRVACASGDPRAPAHQVRLPTVQGGACRPLRPWPQQCIKPGRRAGTSPTSTPRRPPPSAAIRPTAGRSARSRRCASAGAA